jgi:outer membrane protein assembly factor BamB
MKKLLIGTFALALSTALVFAQPGAYKIFTRPSLPSTEALDRMGLTMAWRTRLLLGSNRDGIATIQVLPWNDHAQLFVQTYSGQAALFDAETGDRIWQVQVGKAYTPLFTAGSNSNSIFVSRRTVLHVLNRSNGANRLYSVDKFTGLRTTGIEMPYMATAAPVADENALYFVMSTKAVVFRLPVYGAKGEALRHITPGGEEGEPVLPEAGLLYNIGDEFIQNPPLVAGNQFTVATAQGTIVSANRFEQKIRDEYSVDGKVIAMPGQYGLMTYIGTDRGTLYAFNMDTSRMLWRYLPGGDIRQQPAVLDRDVFVTADRVGIVRLDRATGQEMWFARQLDRFLAANDKFIYALDRRGEFYVLDYMRGGVLAHYDLKDWTLSVMNELNDRIYLAANDGQIICLRHRDLKEPIRYRFVPPPKEEAKEPNKKEEMKKEEMEDKKDVKQEEKKEEKKEKKKEEKKDEKKDDKVGWQRDPRQPTEPRWALNAPVDPLEPALTLTEDDRRRLR